MLCIREEIHAAPYAGNVIGSQTLCMRTCTSPGAAAAGSLTVSYVSYLERQDNITWTLGVVQESCSGAGASGAWLTVCLAMMSDYIELRQVV